MLRLNLCFKNWKESSLRRHQHLRVTRQDPTLGHVVSIGRAKWLFFDVKVINPYSTSYLQHSTKKTLRNAERQKTRYNERILNVECGSFASLIYSVTGGVGPQAKTFDKLLCNKLAYKKRQKYSNIISYYRCKISFLLIE